MPTVADIAALLNVPVRGDASRLVNGIATLGDAGSTDLTFLSSDAHISAYLTTRAAAVIVDRSVKRVANGNSNGDGPTNASLMIVNDADLALAETLRLFAPPTPVPDVGIDPAARVAPDATIARSCRIGPFVHVGARTRIGANTVLHSSAFVGDDVVIGDDCQIFPNVTVRERVMIGHRVILHAGCVIGTDGFGYKWDKSRKQHVKIPHIGTVIIEDDVEIGSCTCVDRAKFAATRIGRGSKLDNLVQIAHNCVVGPLCLVAGQSGLAGSSNLGTGVIAGGQVAIRDHVKVADGTQIAMCSGVYQDTEPHSVISGIPAHDHDDSLRSQAAVKRLPELVKKVRELQRELKELRDSTRG